jgi:hypothetical protein
MTISRTFASFKKSSKTLSFGLILTPPGSTISATILLSHYLKYKKKVHSSHFTQLIPVIILFLMRIVIACIHYLFILYNRRLIRYLLLWYNVIVKQIHIRFVFFLKLCSLIYVCCFNLFKFIFVSPSS